LINSNGRDLQPTHKRVDPELHGTRIDNSCNAQKAYSSFYSIAVTYALVFSEKETMPNKLITITSLSTVSWVTLAMAF